MISREQFENLLEDFSRDIFEYDDITTYEKQICYRQFAKVYGEIKENHNRAYQLHNMLSYDYVDIVRYRNVIASEKLIELTVRQTELYILSMDIALIESGFYTEL